MPIELRQLRYMIAAAEQGSFRGAARLLGVRESAISRRIRDLEDSIGTSLFIRNHAGVQLTKAGERFLANARKVVSQARYAIADAASFGRGETGAVRIGVFTSFASGFLTNLVQSYAAANPKIHLDFIEGPHSDYIAAIHQHELDVAFLTREVPADGCDVTRLWNEHFFVALPSDDDLTQKEELAWEDLQDRLIIVSERDPGPVILETLTRRFADLGQRPNVDRQGVGRDILMNLVATGQGLTLTCEATTAAHFPGVVYRPLSNEILEFCAVWSRRNDNPAFRRFLSLAKKLQKQCPNGHDSAALFAPGVN